jgi:hypothetical protein
LKDAFFAAACMAASTPMVAAQFAVPWWLTGSIMRLKCNVCL